MIEVAMTSLRGLQTTAARFVCAPGNPGTLIAIGLPPTPSGSEYQLTLTRKDGTVDFVGAFSVAQDGKVTLTITAPVPWREYASIQVLTPQTMGGDSLLAGQF